MVRLTWFICNPIALVCLYQLAYDVPGSQATLTSRRTTNDSHLYGLSMTQLGMIDGDPITYGVVQ